jgi:pSer/pThr/pTyr-binding forkhead associated (FHA) protein
MPIPLLDLQLCVRGREVDKRTFRKDTISVGRNPKADIYIDNPSISWDHAILEKMTDGRYRVQDKNSANGTYLNRRRIRNASLSDGDFIGVGKFSLTVTYREDRRKSEGPFSKATTDVVVEPAGPTFALTRDEIDKLLAASDLPPLDAPEPLAEVRTNKTRPEIHLMDSGSPAIDFLKTGRGKLALGFAAGFFVGFLLAQWVH